MNRREFIWQASSLALLPFVACSPQTEETAFPITVHSDMHTAHRLFKNLPAYQPNERISRIVDCLIVGGGIAGLSAGVALAGKKKEFLICELSDRWGGTSGALAYDNLHIAQGAHYELQYPQHFDEKLLRFWEDLGVIYFNKQTAHWEFEDEKYLIADEKEGKTWNGKAYRADVLPETEETKSFLHFIEKHFLGKLKLPTRIIANDLHYLNGLTFLAYMRKEFPRISSELLRAIDYQMLDDYGGTSAQVSALAGLYYYGSRPYTADDNVAFSPPQGNFYFIEKLLAHIPQEALKLNAMVCRIQPVKGWTQVDVLNTQTLEVERIRANKIIYAGQKHALKYLYPSDYPLFEQTQRAPWLVVNVVLKKPLDKPIFWQNEVVKDNLAFLGFVNSLAQGESRQVLSAYYCFKPEDRPKLADVEEQKKYWANYTLQEIADFYRMPQTDLTAQTEAVFMQVMGHAMAIPTPHFLWQDANQKRTHFPLVYAGADVGRLPLMLEACDSGLEAVKILYKNG